MPRVIDPWQQGSRLSWGSDLFRMVPRVTPTCAAPEDIPRPDVIEITLEEWAEEQARAELVDALRPR